jgi:acetyl esterase
MNAMVVSGLPCTMPALHCTDKPARDESPPQPPRPADARHAPGAGAHGARRPPPLHALTPDQARAAYEAGAGVLELAPHKLARVEDLHFTARDGHPLPARLYAPEQPALDRPALPVLLYLHGGGFTVGSIATHDVLCRHLSHLAHCAVVSVDYRLAPQHRFPPPPLTPGTASTGLARQAASAGAGRARLAVGGDSAGGTLAAVRP